MIPGRSFLDAGAALGAKGRSQRHVGATVGTEVPGFLLRHFEYLRAEVVEERAVDLSLGHLVAPRAPHADRVAAARVAVERLPVQPGPPAAAHRHAAGAVLRVLRVGGHPQPGDVAARHAHRREGAAGHGQDAGVKFEFGDFIVDAGAHRRRRGLTLTTRKVTPGTPLTNTR